MVDWKRIELITGPETEVHVKKHGVSLSEVFNVLSGQTYSRKIKMGGDIRHIILGESNGRILMVVLNQQSTNKFYLVTAYEPTAGHKKLYRDKCKK